MMAQTASCEPWMADITGLREEPTLQSDRSARASLVDPAERKHVFASSVVGQATQTLLGEERTMRVVPIRLMPTTGARRIDSDEGRRR